MKLRIDLTPGFERVLQVEAARLGQTPEQFAITVLLERLGITDRAPDPAEKNRRAIELLDSWMEREPDLEEANGYPQTITRLDLTRNESR